MSDFFQFLPGDLPAWAYVAIALILTILAICIARLTGNSNKQSLGSKNTFSGNTSINQQIGSDNTSSKDEQ